MCIVAGQIGTKVGVAKTSDGKLAAHEDAKQFDVAAVKEVEPAPSASAIFGIRGDKDYERTKADFIGIIGSRGP